MCGWSRRSILKYFQYHFTIWLLSPLGKGCGFSLAQTKEDLCQIWLELAHWFWRKKIFLNISNRISHFCHYLPLEKGEALHLNKLESPPYKDVLFQVWLKLAQWFWRKWKCEKFTDRRTDEQTYGWTTQNRPLKKITTFKYVNSSLFEKLKDLPIHRTCLHIAITICFDIFLIQFSWQ